MRELLRLSVIVDSQVWKDSSLDFVLVNLVSDSSNENTSTGVGEYLADFRSILSLIIVFSS